MQAMWKTGVLPLSVELINAALSGQFPIEEMGPHFTKYHLPDGRVFHRFTADDGGAIHDHPWSFTTEILRGGYVEEIWTHGPSQYHAGNQWYRDTHYRRQGEIRHVPATTIHTITSLIGDECWTLVTPEPWQRHTRFYRHDPETGIFVSRRWDEDWECSKTA